MNKAKKQVDLRKLLQVAKPDWIPHVGKLAHLISSKDWSKTPLGISEAERPHLFQRFHRVKGAQGRSFEESGIGLALIQELVKPPRRFDQGEKQTWSGK